MSAVTSSEFVRPIEHQPSKAWMISFADLLSLLLTFFILLFAMSEVRTKEWHELTTSLNDKLNPGRVIMRFEEEQPHTQPLVQTKHGLHLSYAYNVLRDQLIDNYGKIVTLTQLDDRLVLSLQSNALFAPSSAGFSESGLPLIKLVSNAVAKLPNRLEVHGHTDPRPINTKDYPSNWELSLARADAVARLITAAGYEKPLTVFGMADNSYATEHTDKTEAERMAMARRVDIIIRESEPQ